MKFHVLFAAVLLFLGTSAQAQILTCDYSSFRNDTLIEKQYTLDLSQPGATGPLVLGRFAKMRAYSLNGQIMIEAKRNGMRITSTSVNGEKTNLRLETNSAIYEAFCSLL